MASRVIKLAIGQDMLQRGFLIKNIRTLNTNHKDIQQGSSNQDEFIIKKISDKLKSNSLVVMFGFYGATNRAIQNYSDLYQSLGFDVLHVPSYLKHFAWPKNSVSLAGNLLSYLNTTCSSYDQIVIHAFSMGAYNFTVCMGEMYTKPELYGHIQKNIKAVVYDSLTIGELSNMAIGVGQGVSRNVLVQKVVPLSMSMYFFLTSPWTVKFYDEYIDLFKQKPLEVPTLMFACKNDLMSQYKVLIDIEQQWRQKFNFHLVFKLWEQSKHAAHLHTHKDEYVQVLTGFLSSIPSLIKPIEKKSKL
ncbi:hypothetical protein ACF0H5_004661 [Mactra antiquata]